MLFGMFVDDLEREVLAAAGVDLPLLQSRPLPPLFYADDLALLSTSPAGLQRQLNALHAYATAAGLSVNLTKTEILVFGVSVAHVEEAGSGSTPAAPSPEWPPSRIWASNSMRRNLSLLQAITGATRR